MKGCLGANRALRVFAPLCDGIREAQIFMNLKGKTIAPFCTHEGSGLSDTDRFIAETTGATVTAALEMYGTKAQNWPDEAKQETLAWLKKIGYEK